MAGEKLVFCVVGAGNTGQALAGYLKFKGYPVKLYDRSEWRFKYLRSHPMKLGDDFLSEQTVDLLTTDLREAVENSDVIIVSTVTTAHFEVAKKLAQLVSDGQIVLLHPGRTGGALIFHRIIKGTNPNAEITIGEFETSLFATRLTRSGTKVRYYGVKKGVHLAAVPGNSVYEIAPILKDAFPQLETASNVIYTSLSNYGAMLHPAPVVFNAGRVENRTVYTHYIEGITPSIARFIEKLDEERIELGKAFGVHLKPLTVWLENVYGSKGNDLYEILRNTKPYHSILGPDTLQHRYLVEDTLNGLVPMLRFAEAVPMRLPIMEDLVGMIDHLIEIDTMNFGRNLEDMGMETMTVSQMIDYAVKGRVR